MLLGHVAVGVRRSAFWMATTMAVRLRENSKPGNPFASGLSMRTMSGAMTSEVRSTLAWRSIRCVN